jgi:hypothetical protein
MPGVDSPGRIVGRRRVNVPARGNEGNGVPPMHAERTERKYMLWVCPDCAVERRGDGECGACGKTNCVVPVTVVPEQQPQRAAVVPCDDAAVERAAKALEDEVKARCEWYGLDNWSFSEVAEFVFRAAGEA